MAHLAPLAFHFQTLSTLPGLPKDAATSSVPLELLPTRFQPATRFSVAVLTTGVKLIEERENVSAVPFLSSTFSLTNPTPSATQSVLVDATPLTIRWLVTRTVAKVPAGTVTLSASKPIVRE